MKRITQTLFCFIIAIVTLPASAYIGKEGSFENSLRDSINFTNIASQKSIKAGGFFEDTGFNCNITDNTSAPADITTCEVKELENITYVEKTPAGDYLVKMKYSLLEPYNVDTTSGIQVIDKTTDSFTVVCADYTCSFSFNVTGELTYSSKVLAWQDRNDNYADLRSSIYRLSKQASERGITNGQIKITDDVTTAVKNEVSIDIQNVDNRVSTFETNVDQTFLNQTTINNNLQEELNALKILVSNQPGGSIADTPTCEAGYDPVIKNGTWICETDPFEPIFIGQISTFGNFLKSSSSDFTVKPIDRNNKFSEYHLTFPKKYNYRNITAVASGANHIANVAVAVNSGGYIIIRPWHTRDKLLSKSQIYIVVYYTPEKNEIAN